MTCQGVINITDFVSGVKTLEEEVCLLGSLVSLAPYGIQILTG